MENKVNISNEECLIKTLQFLNNDTFRVGSLNVCNMIQCYPFEQLVQIYGSDPNIISYNAQIINAFLELDNFLCVETYLNPSVHFIISNLNFILNHQDGLAASNELLNVLLKLVRRLHNVTALTIASNVICDIFNRTLRSSHMKHLVMKETVCSFLMEVASNKKYYSKKNADILSCVCNFLLCVGENLVLGFRLIVEIMRAEELAENKKMESIYIFMEVSIREIKQTADNETLRTFLESLFLVWKDCTNANYIKRFFLNTIGKLKLLKRCLGEGEEIKQIAIEVLILVINHEFKHVALPSDILKQELNILAKHKDWEAANCDMVYIIHYLEFIYLGIQHNTSIVSKLIRTLTRTFPTNPLMLKTVILLYGSHADKYYHPNTSNRLLTFLEESGQLEQLLTLHISQLIWILWNGKYSLKKNTLKFWLKFYENGNDIIVCVRQTNNLRLVCEILTNPRDVMYHPSLIKILQNSHDFNVRKLLLVTEMKSLPNGIVSQCLINMESLKDDEPEVGVLLSKQILCIMKQIQDADIMQYACSYSYELLLKYRRYYIIAYPYMEPDVLHFLFKIGKSENDQLANDAINLLRIIVQMQECQRIQPREKIELDLCEILAGSSVRIRRALSLVNSVIKHEHVNTMPLISLQKPSFGMNYKLISLTSGEFRKEAFKLLGRIMRREKYLATTLSNKLFVMYECDGGSNVGFLNFLATWLQIVKDCRCYNLPKTHIINYLDNVHRDEDYKVQIITMMLEKCYTLTPMSSYSKYLK